MDVGRPDRSRSAPDAARAPKPDRRAGGRRQADERRNSTLREKIKAGEEHIVAADKARAEAEARLSEMRDSLHRAEQEKARISADGRVAKLVEIGGAGPQAWWSGSGGEVKVGG